MKLNNESGSILGIAAIVSLVLAVVVLSLASSLSQDSKAQVHFQQMNSTFHMAESAMQEALGQLSINPGATFTPQVGLGGAYEVQAMPASFTDRNGQETQGIYTVVTASKTIDGKVFASRLHAYSVVTNIGSYFAAIKNELKLSDGIDLSQGKVYASTVTFFFDGSSFPQTKVERIEYFNQVRSTYPTSVAYNDLSTWGPEFGELAAPAPVRLPAPLVFPQLLDSDIYRLLSDAKGHEVCDFTGLSDIYPPYYGTTSNLEHTYFCKGDLLIGNPLSMTKIHGQIVFVSTGDVHIRGSIVSADFDSTLADGGFKTYAGALGETGPLASLAHQAVFITRGNVVIDPTFDLSGADKTLTLNAMLMAPNGTLQATSYPDPTQHSKLHLSFWGSLILSNVDGDLPVVFAGGRKYSYMNSLKIAPPPGLPNFTEIHYIFEDSLGEGRL